MFSLLQPIYSIKLVRFSGTLMKHGIITKFVDIQLLIALNTVNYIN